MLYNGKEPFPEKKVMRLSDTFPMEGDVELTVTAYNINYSEENKLLQKCRPLHDYSLFIHRVDENKNQGSTLEQAILTAIKDCRTDGIMADFLEKHHGEVFEMVSLKWDEEEAKKFYESEGEIRGKKSERISSIRNLMETVGWTAQQAMDALKIPAAEQAKYAALL